MRSLTECDPVALGHSHVPVKSGQFEIFRPLRGLNLAPPDAGDRRRHHPHHDRVAPAEVHLVGVEVGHLRVVSEVVLEEVALDELDSPAHAGFLCVLPALANVVGVDFNPDRSTSA